MEQITAFLGSINFNEIITVITDELAKIDLQKIVDEIIKFVTGLFAAK